MRTQRFTTEKEANEFAAQVKAGGWFVDQIIPPTTKSKAHIDGFWIVVYH